jgi:hypothetical protein
VLGLSRENSRRRENYIWNQYKNFSNALFVCILTEHDLEGLSLNPFYNFSSCPGYEGYSTIQIIYDINGDPNGKRAAFLPNSPRGQKVLANLRIDFDNGNGSKFDDETSWSCLDYPS